MVEKKFKAYSEKRGMSEPVTFADIINGRVDFSGYDTYLQYLGYADANGHEIYDGDVTELMVTEELMDKNKNLFYNSNLGKYLMEHPEVTSIVLEHRITSTLSMNYMVYAKTNGKFKYRQNKEPKYLSFGEDSDFPIYLAQKGTVYIGNTIESPYLIKQEPSLKQNDIFSYCRPFRYKGDCRTDGKAAVIQVKDGVVTVQFIERYLGTGNIERLPIEEVVNGADFKYEPLTLESYLMRYNSYNQLYESDEEAIKFYMQHYHVSEKDLEFLESLNTEKDTAN